MEISTELAAELYGVLCAASAQYKAAHLDGCAEHARHLAHQLLTVSEELLNHECCCPT
jgi:hypothetical protein